MIHNSGFVALNYIAGVVVLVPMPFHIANRNVAVCCLFATLSVGCLITAINASIWQEIKSPAITAPVYCDVAARYVDTMQVICLGCGLAILRYLAVILRSRGASATSAANKTRQALADLAIIYTLPFLMLLLQGLFLNPVRYRITPTIGCRLALPVTKLTILYAMPNCILALACSVYAVLIIFALYKKRKEFREVLRSSQSGLSAARFIRLFVLALGTLVVFVPLRVYQTYLYLNAIVGPGAQPLPYNIQQLAPWFDNGKGQITVLYGHIDSVDWRFWVFPLLAFFFAALFGVGREANKAYKNWARSIGLGRVVERLERLKAPAFASRLSSQFSSIGRMKSSNDSSQYEKDIDLESDPVDYSVEGDSSSELGMDLGRGHNKGASKSQARVWSEAGVPCSPHKIKVFSVAAQTSE